MFSAFGHVNNSAALQIFGESKSENGKKIYKSSKEQGRNSPTPPLQSLSDSGKKDQVLNSA